MSSRSKLNVNEAVINRVRRLDRDQLSRLSRNAGIDGRILQKVGLGEVPKSQLDKISKAFGFVE